LASIAGPAIAKMSRDVVAGCGGAEVCGTDGKADYRIADRLSAIVSQAGVISGAARSSAE
jgi:hypothetical protein